MEASTHPVSLKSHIVDLIKQAGGAKPVASAIISADPQMDALLREMLRDVLDRRRSYGKEVARFAPDLGRLYSAASFSTPTAMRRKVDGQMRHSRTMRFRFDNAARRSGRGFCAGEQAEGEP